MSVAIRGLVAKLVDARSVVRQQGLKAFLALVEDGDNRYHPYYYRADRRKVDA